MSASVPEDPVPPEIRGLLAQVRQLLIGTPDRIRFSPEIGADGRQLPMVPVEKSVTRNFLVCLETGARLVMLRRHLRENLQMTPEEYREKWGLPPEYPMVAAVYRQRRAESIKREE